MASLQERSEKYCNITKNGKLIVELDKAKDDAFMQGWLCKDICKAVISKNNSSKTGGNNVDCQSIFGRQYSMPRREFVKNFKTSYGRKIKMSTMRNNQEYLVWTPIQQPVFFMLLPDNCVGRMNGSNIASGHYMLFFPDAEGNMDRSSLFVLRKDIARKVLVVPGNNFIENRSSGGNRISFKARGIVKSIINKAAPAQNPRRRASKGEDANRRSRSMQEKIAMDMARQASASLDAGNNHRRLGGNQSKLRQNSRIGEREKKQHIDYEANTWDMPDEINMNMGTGELEMEQEEVGKILEWCVDTSGGDYWCVGKLIKSDKNVPCGYVLEHDGEREQLKFDQVAEVCRAGKCGNMELVEGNKFKGKGIKLKDLPVEYVD